MWALWESRVLCEISKSCGRVLCVHRMSVSTSSSRSRKISIVRIHDVEDARDEKGGYQRSHPLEKIAPGGSFGFSRESTPSRFSDHAHRPSVLADRARSSNTAGLT